MRTYTELCQHSSLEDRFSYLELSGTIGTSTFGFDRWINQQFYRSKEWRQIRNHVIIRDDGMDLGSSDIELQGSPYIHHMNPLTLEDLENMTDNLLDPEFLISTSLRTHNAIHYGNKTQLPRRFVSRSPGDTRLW